ncbi:mitochondrial substrate carrier family protein [Acrasis kona]|uniref:Mitochondrial substrate carrier family protein n=1 Tax=Acrasis kona TaxID=1008807 RepID=A0AAW2Z1N0_9EUKA
MFVENLACGGIAGIVAVSCVFPLDMVKTRLMNQSSNATRTVAYNGVVDCFKKIIQTEGVSGLYRGLPANLVGITPEKAIKLAGNDFFRSLFSKLYFKTKPAAPTDVVKQLPVSLELLAGGCAGAVQVVATNPMEIVKIRMQTSKGVSTIHVLKELGLKGLYKGSAATLSRDIPFSMVYFCLYSRLKHHLSENKQDPSSKISLKAIIPSAIVAGSTAAFFTTPLDVIKTRLQAHGETQLKTIGQVYRHIMQNEGAAALFKGCLPRVLIMSPLFGITLTVYELLQNFLGINKV